jgi:SAM-dependent methyltransferase
MECISFDTSADAQCAEGLAGVASAAKAYAASFGPTAGRGDGRRLPRWTANSAWKAGSDTPDIAEADEGVLEAHRLFLCMSGRPVSLYRSAPSDVRAPRSDPRTSTALSWKVTLTRKQLERLCTVVADAGGVAAPQAFGASEEMLLVIDTAAESKTRKPRTGAGIAASVPSRPVIRAEGCSAVRATACALFCRESLRMLDRFNPARARRVCLDSKLLGCHVNRGAVEAFLSVLHRFEWAVRERFLVISGTVMMALGISCTTDVDVLVWNADGLATAAVEELIKRPLIDLKVYDGVSWRGHKKGQAGHGATDAILGDRFNRVWADAVGAADFYQLMFEPGFTFWAWGLKFIRIEGFIHQRQSRISANDIVDIAAVNEYLGFRFAAPCVAHVTMSLGKLIVFTKQRVQTLRRRAARAAAEWYRINLPSDWIRACDGVAHPDASGGYNGRTVRYPGSSEYVRAARAHVHELIARHVRPGWTAVEVGSGRLGNIEVLRRFRRVLAIEPSAQSVAAALRKTPAERLLKIDVFRGYGDRPWADAENPAGVPAPDRAAFASAYAKYRGRTDVALFVNTIHYMWTPRGVPVLMANLGDALRGGGRVLITVLDGDLLHAWFSGGNGVYFASDENGIVFAVSPEYDAQDARVPPHQRKVLVYFRGVYGLQGGISEPLVSLVDMRGEFEARGYKLLETRPYDLGREDSLSLQISRVYAFLAFERGAREQTGAGRRRPRVARRRAPR